MMIPSIAQRKKKFLRMTLAYFGVLLCLFLARAYQQYSSGMSLQVSARGGEMIDHTDYHLSGNDRFVYGMEGTLHWKPKSMFQAMVLTCINDKGVDLFDILGLLITAAIIFYMFKDSKDNTPFTKKMAAGFGKLLIALAVTGTACNLGRSMLALRYIPYITDSKFSMYIDYKVLSYHWLAVMFLIPFLSQIPYFGLDLQKEQELTI